MNKISMKQAFSYIRMSAKSQLSGDSRRRQEERSREYAAQSGYQFIESVDDIGVSAFKGKNIKEGELGRFRDALERGDIEPKNTVLLVESLDRLSRENVLDAFEELNRFLKTGVTIVTMVDRQHYTREKLGENVGMLFTAIGVMLRANDESAHKSDRGKRTWEQKRKSVGTKTYTSVCPAWLSLNKKSDTFEPIEDRKKVIEKIFKMSQGGYGNLVITRWLNENNIPTFGRSDGWHRSYVQKILTNRAVIGEFQPHTFEGGKRVKDGDPVSDYFPVIVDPADFIQVQDERQSRKIGGGRKGRYMSNIFTNLLKCGVCGSPMRYVDKGAKPKGGQFLMCSRLVRGMKCLRMPWEYGDFQTSVLAYIERIDFSTFLKTDAAASKLISLRDAVKRERAKLETVKRKLDNLINQIENGIDIPEIKDRVESLSKERNALEMSINQMNREISKESRSISNLGSRVHELEQVIDKDFATSEVNETTQQLRFKLHQTLRNVIEKIVIYPGGGPRLPFPVKEKRFFAIHFLSGDRQIVEPAYDEPSRFRIMIATDGRLKGWKK